MRRNRLPRGGAMDGFTRRIHVAGFSGTAVTTWGAAPQMTSGRYVAGARSPVTSPQYAGTATAVTSNAARDSARRCCIGRMTAALSELRRVARFDLPSRHEIDGFARDACRAY